MKQRITSDQLLELPIDALNKWMWWCESKGYSQRASIGELIEYVVEHKPRGPLGISRLTWKTEVGPCDDLWKEIKEVLKGGETK